MGKIIKKRVEYGGSSNSAENIKYDDTKNVKEAINEVKSEIAGVNSNLDNIVDTGWLSVTFNQEYQKNIGSLSELTRRKITTYQEVKAIDLITTHHIGVNVASNNNVYLHPTNSGSLTVTFEYRLRIHY